MRLSVEYIAVPLWRFAVLVERAVPHAGVLSIRGPDRSGCTTVTEWFAVTRLDSLRHSLTVPKLQSHRLVGRMKISVLSRIVGHTHVTMLVFAHFSPTASAKRSNRDVHVWIGLYSMPDAYHVRLILEGLAQSRSPLEAAAES